MRNWKRSVFEFCQEEAQAKEGNTEGTEADVAVCQEESRTGKGAQRRAPEERGDPLVEGYDRGEAGNSRADL